MLIASLTKLALADRTDFKLLFLNAEHVHVQTCVLKFEVAPAQNYEPCTCK